MKNIIGVREKLSSIVQDKNFLKLIAFYLLAHGGILLISNAIYWDDWILFQGRPEIVVDMFTQQAGTLLYLEGYAHVALLKIGPWIYRVMTLCLMFMAGFFLDKILKKYLSLNDELRFFIVLLFLIFPFYSARVSLIDFRYTVCYFLFFWAWFLMDRHRYSSMALFFISFNTNSLLVFYAVPIIDQIIRGRYFVSYKAARKYLIDNFLFLILPFVYFLIKTQLFPPSGIYFKYNEQYSWGNLISTPLLQFENLGELSFKSIHLFLILLFSILSYWFLKKNQKNILANKDKTPLWALVALGLLAFIFAGFPYWILGHVPTFNEWSSRHQLLLPLGFSLLLVGIICIAWSKQIGRVSLFLIIGASLFVNLSNYVRLYIDWKKQQSLVELFAKNEYIREAKVIVFDDATKELNALDRSYRDYEWNGLVKMALGGEGRYCVDISNWNSKKDAKSDRMINKYYLAADFDLDTLSDPLHVKIERIRPLESTLGQKIFYFVSPMLTLNVQKPQDTLQSNKF